MTGKSWSRDYRISRNKDNYHRYRRVLLLYMILALLFLTRNLYYFTNEIHIFPSYTSVYALSLGISGLFSFLLPLLHRRRWIRALNYSILAVSILLFFLMVNLCLLDSFFIEDVDFTAYIFGALMLGFIFRSDWWLHLVLLTAALVYYSFSYYFLRPDLFELSALLPLGPISACAFYFSFSRDKMNRRLFRTSYKLAESNRRLIEQTRRDALTGLYNRRYMEDFLKHQMALFKREKCDFSLIFGDIDHFKRINDELGHDVGDQVLRKLALLLEKESRDSDLVVRYGGEEFLIVLPGTICEEAFRLAERIRTTMEKRCFSRVPWTVTVSFGIAGAQSGDEPRDIIRRADEKLYIAKRQGRNLCIGESLPSMDHS